MKKFLSLALILVLTLSLFSVAFAEEYRVAYIARAQADSFAAWLANGVKEEAEKYPDITVDIFDGQANDETENSLAQPYEQAAVNARYALDKVPEGATAVILRGPAGNFHADERLKAWTAEFFDKRPDVTIVGDDYANWNKDEAMALMEDWVTKVDKPIGLIASMNDNMCAGALEVIKDNPDYKDVLSFGVDGTAEACLLIEEGRMTATCLQNAYELAALLLDTSHKLLTGEETQIDTDVGNPLYTIDNVAELREIHVKAGALQ